MHALSLRIRARFPGRGALSDLTIAQLVHMVANVGVGALRVGDGRDKTG